jgi:hypothetical protein
MPSEVRAAVASARQYDAAADEFSGFMASRRNYDVAQGIGADDWPFINAVYIGHPGWKAMGCRIGYSAATGFMVIILSWFAVVSVLLALVPVVAISPILLYIGMLIGAQAFQTTPAKHAPGAAPRPSARALASNCQSRIRYRSPPGVH